MPARLDNHKRRAKLLFGVKRQYPLKLRMHGSLRRGQQAQIDDPGTAALDENKTAEITVTSDEDPSLVAYNA
jgi:hypothetical protein